MDVGVEVDVDVVGRGCARRGAPPQKCMNSIFCVFAKKELIHDFWGGLGRFFPIFLRKLTKREI